MRAVLIVAVLLQFGQRPPLAPAETLLEPKLLSTIERASVEGKPGVIPGTDVKAGEVALACRAGHCEAVEWAMNKLATADVARPARTVRMVVGESLPPNTKAGVFIAESQGQNVQVLRGLWSTASVADEVVELFGRHAVKTIQVRAYEYVGQPEWEDEGIPVVAIVPPADPSGFERVSVIAAASAYFLATLPNAGAESLLSHLTVGAHARLAEDGRRAVAMMGNQQRAGGDVLVLLGQAIEREQRRMRSFERFMPTPVDPMLRSRIAEMEKSITTVWSSLGITSSPFVPAAERLRGRAGEDRRVPALSTVRVDARVTPPPALAALPNGRQAVNELLNFIDGKRSISDIRDAVAAEFGSIPLPAVVDYFQALANARIISLR